MEFSLLDRPMDGWVDGRSNRSRDGCKDHTVLKVAASHSLSLFYRVTYNCRLLGLVELLV